MFVNYLGTKETFISKGYDKLYENQIVFIRDTGCIYTRNNYFADFQAFLNAISFVKGVKLDGSLYEVSKGGGYLSLSEKIHYLKDVVNPIGEDGETKTLPISSEVVYDGTTSSIRFGLSDEFINQINNIIDEVLKIKGDYLTDQDRQDLEKLVKGNVSEDFNTLEKLENKIKGFKDNLIEGDRIKIDKSESSDEITISALSEIDDTIDSGDTRTWSIDKIKEKIDSFKLKNGDATFIGEDNSINISVDGSSIKISEKNELSVNKVDGGTYSIN